jgi:dipeptidase
VWYAPHSAPGSSFVPFCAGCSGIATEYATGNPNQLDRGSAYWAHRYVFNVMHLKYSYVAAVLATVLLLEDCIVSREGCR